ncbi:hypothetical protein CEP48_07200 [Mergibacter septicus]|uniref:Uncharacterized protein n=1 Tax=Mergibacter septicus TaxID=221402 RepID=A0A8D4LJW8_9PAST|nr:hypothetical protein [Mergibacter septicus]AWX15970.1 hypothetical protein CEP47_07200 [Mergibacter septicus]QDJ15223.1 hypothetical protein CEP48_07200 [Mergibacter septicus]UTU47357.1 hypothetical protein HLL31_00380 [Mergibacter septicus]WMR95463.1 hypothetical protein RDJ12_05770 [Mergibacter septicus]
MKFNSTILSILSLIFSIALVAYIVLNNSEDQAYTQDHIVTLKDEVVKLQQQVETLAEKYTGLETEINNLTKHKKAKKVVTTQDVSNDDLDLDEEIKKLSAEINKMKTVINKLNRRMNKIDDSSDSTCPFKISDRNTGRLSCVQ